MPYCVFLNPQTDTCQSEPIGCVAPCDRSTGRGVLIRSSIYLRALKGSVEKLGVEGWGVGGIKGRGQFFWGGVAWLFVLGLSSLKNRPIAPGNTWGDNGPVCALGSGVISPRVPTCSLPPCALRQVGLSNRNQARWDPHNVETKTRRHRQTQTCTHTHTHQRWQIILCHMTLCCLFVCSQIVCLRV